MIQSIDHIAITMPKGNEEAALHFYGGILNLPTLEKPVSLAGRGGVWFELPNRQQLHLQAESSHVPAHRAHPAFASNNLEEIAVKLESTGLKVKWDEELAPRRRFYSEDVFGNRLEFIEPL